MVDELTFVCLSDRPNTTSGPATKFGGPALWIKKHLSRTTMAQMAGEQIVTSSLHLARRAMMTVSLES